MSPAAATSGALASTATVVVVVGWSFAVVSSGATLSPAHAVHAASSATTAPRMRLLSSVGERFGERGVHEQRLDDVGDL